jgi:hypothetical protein
MRSALVCGALFLSVMSDVCVAQEFHIDARSEALYQKALPYLQQAHSKLEAVPFNFPKANVEDKKRGLELSEEAGRDIGSAIPLLEQASELGHPVAQYRLALIYYLFNYSIDETRAKVCPLVQQSFAHGFAPSALIVSNACWDFPGEKDFNSNLKVVESNTAVYEKYYPQPAIQFECREKAPEGFAMPWGDSLDFQAEIYRLQGDRDRGRRKELYEKAIAINGCYKAKRRIGYN